MMKSIAIADFSPLIRNAKAVKHTHRLPSPILYDTYLIFQAMARGDKIMIMLEGSASYGRLARVISPNERGGYVRVRFEEDGAVAMFPKVSRIQQRRAAAGGCQIFKYNTNSI